MDEVLSTTTSLIAWPSVTFLCRSMVAVASSFEKKRGVLRVDGNVELYNIITIKIIVKTANTPTVFEKDPKSKCPFNRKKHSYLSRKLEMRFFSNFIVS